MTEKAWKRTERLIAEAVGGTRVPVTGRQRGDAPDIKHEWLSIESKHKKKLPDWLHDAMKQAKAAQRDNQLPIVVLHESGMRHTDDYVVIRLGDFTEWFGEKSEGTPV